MIMFKFLVYTKNKFVIKLKFCVRINTMVVARSSTVNQREFLSTKSFKEFSPQEQLDQKALSDCIVSFKQEIKFTYSIKWLN